MAVAADPVALRGKIGKEADSWEDNCYYCFYVHCDSYYYHYYHYRYYCYCYCYSGAPS